VAYRALAGSAVHAVVNDVVTFWDTGCYLWTTLGDNFDANSKNDAYRRTVFLFLRIN